MIAEILMYGILALLIFIGVFSILGMYRMFKAHKRELKEVFLWLLRIKRKK